MFRPLKSLFKYIKNLHVKPLKDDKLKRDTKETAAAENPTIITTKTTLSSTSVLTSAASSSSSSAETMQSGEIFETNRINVNLSPQTNEVEQQSNHQAQCMDDTAPLLTNAAYIDYDEDDIETQIKSSIMLKKPLTNNFIRKKTEIISPSSTSSSSFGIGIAINVNSRDNFNSYEIVTPHYNGSDVEDDELEDFRYDPMENFENNSSHNKTTITVIKSPAIYNDVHQIIDNDEDEIVEDGEKIEIECITSENLEEKQSITLNDGEMNEQNGGDEQEENEDEPFVNLKNITRTEIIVDTELSSATCQGNDNNHKDEILPNDVQYHHITITNNNNDYDNDVDPLEIAKEDHEAFNVNRTSVLEQLNLLNPLGLSQDDEDDAMTDGELECWLDNDENDNEKQTSQIGSDNADDGNSEVHKQSSSSCVDERGDGSDSGLGSETSALQITMESMHEASQLLSSLNPSLTATGTTPTITERDHNETLKPTSMPTQRHSIYSSDDKRKEDASLASSSSISSLTIPVPAKESTTAVKRSNLKRRLKADTDHANINLDLSNVAMANVETKEAVTTTANVQKKPKRSISFNSVHIYYFARQQGFNCVPSAGGCTLGMAAIHESSKTMTLTEHTAELRRAHRLQLQEINPRGSSSDESEESEEDFLSECSSSDLDGESSGFLQPVSPKQRRAILKAAGVRKIDPVERAECRDIRNSREICGCNCRNYCDPEICSCSQSGIKCQVDRDMFPCGCTRESCANPIGRVEFNSDRVHTHYIHTLLRLEVENGQENPYHMHHAPNVLDSTTSSASPAAVALTTAAATASLTMPSCGFYQNHMPTQSNYSSGYASPAYNISSDSMTQSALADLNGDYYNCHSVQQQPPTGSAHIYNSHLNITHTAIINQYNVDALDAGLYSTATATAAASTCSYAAAAARVNSTANAYHNIDYDQIPSRQQLSPATFNAYHNTNTMTNNRFLNTSDDVSMMVCGTSLHHHAYSSCAVPSDPPYGAATTTESSIIEFATTNQLVTVLETTTAPSCVALTAIDITPTMETEETNNFINALHAVSESNITHNKSSSNNNNNTNKNNNNNNKQISDILQHGTAAATTTATINGHMPVATMASASASAAGMQQQKRLRMEVEIETTTASSTARATPSDALTMNDLRHDDAPSQKIVNNPAHTNVLECIAVATATKSTNLEDDAFDSIAATATTTTLTTIMNDVMINS